MATAVTSRTVVSYTAFPPLPLRAVAVYLCCTGLGVTSTGRYPASCPVKPGLSSPAVFRHLQPRSFVLLNRILIMPSFVRKCKGILHVKTTTSDELPYQRIVVDVLAGDRKEIVEDLQQPLCLHILRRILGNIEK